MQKIIIPVCDQRGYMYHTEILDDYQEARLQKIHADDRRTTYRLLDGDNRYILKTLYSSLGDPKEIEAFKNEYHLHCEMAKCTRNVLKPIDLKECTKEERGEVYVEALYEYGETNLLGFIEKADAQRVLDIAKKSLDALTLLTERTKPNLDIRPENFLYENGDVKLIDFGVPACDKASIVYVVDSYTKHGGIYTYAYCPPEVHKKPSLCLLDKIEVYCWGMTLYQLMTRKSKNELQIEAECFKHPEKDYELFLKEVKKISMVNDEGSRITRALISILLETLEADPKKRPDFNKLKSEIDAIEGLEEPESDKREQSRHSLTKCSRDERQNKKASAGFGTS